MKSIVVLILLVAGACSLSPFNIEEDNKDVKKMVNAAKSGEWSTVNKILDAKPYLVNGIPEGSGWGVLHYAVYLNNKDAVSKILGMKTCDALIKTMVLEKEIDESSTALAIAVQLGDSRKEIKKMIEDNIKDERSKRFSDDIPYKVSLADGEKTAEELPLFIREIALYKNTLLGEDKPPKDHLFDILRQIFKKEDSSWSKIEDQLKQSLYGKDIEAAAVIEKTKTEEEFFIAMIKLYTGNWVYKQLNQALAREYTKDYNPTAEDLALGLHGVLLDVTISFWKKLEPMSSKTYRGVKSKSGSYPVGQDIMFTTFVSSSDSEADSRKWAGDEGTLFIMDNSVETTSRPRKIMEYSEYPDEREYLYAIGAEFRVKANEEQGKLRVIHLELLKACKLCGNL
eukprot:Seg353.2 transcript_id=Seg353.2/GoldUCD/mRNA.D3Y31 product="hypothetical protein" protein_id=Seg353.2/GoldUCD/D3Y31